VFVFKVETKLKRKIKLTETRWRKILIKHPIMENKQMLVMAALLQSDEIRISKIDSTVFLYYKKINEKLICVVCKHLNKEGFIITSYLTDRIKEGELVWRKS
jgi:hypothetical protein